MGRDAGALVRSMLALRGEQKTGVFQVDAGGVRTLVYFMDGAVVYAEDLPPGETLGRLLVRERLLTPEQYTRVLQQMTEAEPEREQLRFGAVAVECGYLTDEQLDQALVDQIKWRIIRAFQREDHEWSLREGRGAVDGVPLFYLPLEPLVLQAALALSREASADLIPAASRLRFPVHVADPSAIAVAFELKPGESAFVESIDGCKSVSDLISTSVSQPVRMHQSAILAALLWTRSVEADRPIGSADGSRSRCPGPRAAALANDARGGDPRHARSRPAQPEPKRTTRRGHARWSRTRRACRRSWRFRRARVTCAPDAGARPWRNSAPRACSIRARPSFELYTRWFEAGAGQKDIEPAPRLAIKRAAMASNRNDPNLAFPLYVLGRVSLLEGNKTDGARWLERALVLEPGMRDAERELRAMKRKGGKPGAEDGASETGDEASTKGGEGLLGRVAGWLGRDKT